MRYGAVVSPFGGVVEVAGGEFAQPPVVGDALAAQAFAGTRLVGTVANL
jgi:hypothetical protein